MFVETYRENFIRHIKIMEYGKSDDTVIDYEVLNAIYFLQYLIRTFSCTNCVAA